MNAVQKRVTKRVPFCAAHHIPGAGKCENNHGHNWVANITVDQISGELDSRGFVVDVRDLKDTAFKYDHDDLNKYFDMPSTENVAQKIADDALALCVDSRVKPPGDAGSSAVFIVNVHLIETENNSADASASNFTASNFGAFENKNNLQEQIKAAHEAEGDWSFGSGDQIPPAKARFVRRDK